MSRAQRVPAANVHLRQLLQGTRNGDLFAMDSLETLATEDRSVLKQFLPIVSHFLQFPHPEWDCNIERGPSREEILAEKSILAIIRCSANDKQINGIVETLVLEKIAHIIRWMVFLFDIWAFRRWRFEGRPVQSIPKEYAAIHALRASIRTTIPSAFQALAEHPVIRSILLKHAGIGPLFAQTFLVAIRDDDDQMLSLGVMTFSLVQSWEDHKAGEAFFQYIGFLSHFFAEELVSRVRQYSRPIAVAQAPKLRNILLHLYHCALDRDNVLDACLEQPGIIRALTSILVRAVAWLEHCEEFIHDAQRESVTVIFTIISTLNASFSRGGVVLVATALENDLLGAILRIRKFLAVEHIGNSTATDRSRVEGVGETLTLLLETILPFIIYPSVMKKASSVISKTEIAYPGLSSKAPYFQTALDRFAYRIEAELEITARVRRSRSKLIYPDPYKFCDNAMCPTTAVTKLGRCIGCFSAYYCSRQCQKIDWQSEHGKECRAIAITTSGGREGFPPVAIAHDKEYLSRMTRTFFDYHYTQQYRKPPGHFDKNDIFRMDLNTYPVTITHIDRDQFDEEHFPGGGGPYPGEPVLMAKHVGCTKVDPEGHDYLMVTHLSNMGIGTRSY